MGELGLELREPTLQEVKSENQEWIVQKHSQVPGANRLSVIRKAVYYQGRLKKPAVVQWVR